MIQLIYFVFSKVSNDSFVATTETVASPHNAETGATTDLNTSNAATTTINAPVTHLADKHFGEVFNVMRGKKDAPTTTIKTKKEPAPEIPTVLRRSDVFGYSPLFHSITYVAQLNSCSSNHIYIRIYAYVYTNSCIH